MKKSIIIITLGLFIVVTAFLGVSNEKMYQKQESFESIQEVFQQLNGRSLKVIDSKGDLSETNEFKECLSERKRLTNSQFYFEKIEIQREDSLNEKEKNSILEVYNKARNNFTKRRPITIEEPVRLTVNAYSVKNIEKGIIKYGEPIKLKLDLVLIDEGEGLVIDYINQTDANKFNEEGNIDA